MKCSHRGIVLLPGKLHMSTKLMWPESADKVGFEHTPLAMLRSVPLANTHRDTFEWNTRNVEFGLF